jgi:hypothetical protein
MIRRLRLGNLRRLLRDRNGPILPDDDAGREYLHELLLAISVGSHAEIKMSNAIEVWAPWMQQDEATRLTDEINRTPIWHRMPTAHRLGKRLRVTNGERERLKLWTIAPYNRSPQEMLAQRRAKDRERKRRYRERQRQQQGTATRAQWLAAHSISRDKPWLSLGIKRSTYYYRLQKHGTADVKQVGQAPSAVRLEKHRTPPVQSSKPHLSRAVQATSTPKLNINRKSQDNRSAENIAAAATNRPRVLRTQPVSSTIPPELRNS